MPEFSGQKFGDKQLVSAVKNARWKQLSLIDTAVTDHGIVMLEGMPFEEICIRSSLITDQSVQSLCSSQTLKSLLLDGVPQLSDDGIAFISRSSSIRELYLNGCKLTNSGLKHLANLHELWSLSCDDTAVDDRGICELKHLEKIRLLSLCRTKVTGVGLRYLIPINRLSLYLSGCPVNHESIEEMVSKQPHIEILRIDSTEVTDHSMPVISGLHGLCELDVSQTQITERGVLALLSHPSLRQLYLRGIDVTPEVCLKLKEQSSQRMSVYVN